MRISDWSSDVCSSDLEDPAWTTYKSDTVRNHELGIKGRVGRMSYNADVFYVDWKDPQVNSSTTWWGFFAVQNAQKASTRRSEEHTSELQSLMRISYAVFCLKKKKVHKIIIA